METACTLLGAWIVIIGAWRITCLFRRKGSCRFRKCPFRKDYTDTSFMNVLSGGCKKCLPDEDEMEVYRHTADGIVDGLRSESRDGDRGLQDIQ